MFYKSILFIIITIFLSNCTIGTLIKDKPKKTSHNNYKNKGFALIYNENFYNQKVISEKINERSLVIFQKKLKINTQVKITNILNNKSIIVMVGKNSKYPSFYNSVLSIRIADELDLDISQPYIEILEIIDNSTYIAKKAKTYDEEKKVAVKSPIENISIYDLNPGKKNVKIKSNLDFSYSVKLADFFFKETALIMLERIRTETSIKIPKMKKINNQKYRVYLGPYRDINSLQKSYNDISILNFENIEIIKND